MEAFVANLKQGQLKLWGEPIPMRKFLQTLMDLIKEPKKFYTETYQTIADDELYQSYAGLLVAAALFTGLFTLSASSVVSTLVALLFGHAIASAYVFLAMQFLPVEGEKKSIKDVARMLCLNQSLGALLTPVTCIFALSASGLVMQYAIMGFGAYIGYQTLRYGFKFSKKHTLLLIVVPAGLAILSAIVGMLMLQYQYHVLSALQR